jgi:membrane-associated phospholipid phosphatase
MLRRPGVLLALTFAGVLALVALWVVANHVAAGRELDAALGDELHGRFPASASELLKGATSLADTLPVAVGAAGLVALAWLRGGRPLAGWAALVLLVSNGVTQLAQPSLTAARHVDLSGTALEGSGSWPSGHATAAMLLALCAIGIAGPRLRAITALVGIGYALGVGAALVTLGGHLPSDVVAGYLVAAAFTTAAAALYAALRPRWTARQPERGARAARRPIVAPALGVLAGAAMLATAIGKAIVTRRDEVAAAVDSVLLVFGATAALVLIVVLGAGAALVLRR